MTKNELFKLLNGHEWNEVEFKRAQRGVPDAAYETVSSFSNTSGGWLVFGIVDNGGQHEIAGVLDVDKVQNDFLSALRADNKVNHDIQVESKLIDVDSKIVLAFRIPEASRQNKPIYLNRDIRRSVRYFPGPPWMCNGSHQISVIHSRRFVGWTVSFLKIILS